MAYFDYLFCEGAVVNAAIVAGKAAKPAIGSSDGTEKIPTYLGSVSVQRGRCVVIVSPTLITVARRSVSWSRDASVNCGQAGQAGHFSVDVAAHRQVSVDIIFIVAMSFYLVEYK